jgi:hypothetical protein
MLDWLRYRRDLARTKKRNAKDLEPLERAYVAAFRAQNKPRSEIDELREKWLDQVGFNSDRIKHLETDYLTSQAQKHLVPFPPFPQEILDADREILRDDIDLSAKWAQSSVGPEMVLTDESVKELRLALRADRRERLEIVRSWVATIVPGLTGLIGVIIGLLAVILGRR